MNEASRGNLRTYVMGFTLSIVLTLIAYVLVVKDVLSGNVLITAIIGLAIAQLFVQLIFFLHLGRESKPRWNLTALTFAIIVVGIIVIGSLWIMQNLNYSHQHGSGETSGHSHNESPEAADQYIIKDELIKN